MEETKGKLNFPRDMLRKISLLVLFLGWEVLAAAAENPEHFRSGQFRGSLRWDGTDSEKTELLRFGGAAGIFVLDGFEVGYEQLFEVPPQGPTAVYSWLYTKLVLFRDWVVAPFLAFRVGLGWLGKNRAAFGGAGLGAVFFVSPFLGFESRWLQELRLDSGSVMDNYQVFDWQMVLYY
jgi:hypothetical protein